VGKSSFSKGLAVRAALLSLAFIFLIVTAPGQTTLASLDGNVTDEKGETLAGAVVALRNVETGYSYSSVSRSDGRYMISGIAPGKYALKVSLSGFAVYENPALTFNVSAKLTLDCILVPTALSTEITVTAESPMIEVTKSEISSVVNREQIDSLPLLNRDYGELASLHSGVQASTISDFDLRSNGLPYGMEESLIDGVSNENAQANTYMMSIPADAIQEFRVMTNLFSAEYGNSAGMIRSVITRSGTNQLRGRLSLFLRDEFLDTPNYFANHEGYKGQKLEDVDLPNYQHYNFSGFVGGPIKKDKAHFFFSYEGLFQKQYATVNSPLVSQESVELPADTHGGLFKIDYQLNEKNIIVFSTSARRVGVSNYLVGGFMTKERGVDVIDKRLETQFSWTYFVSPESLNELRLFYAYNGYEAPPSDPTLADSYSITRPSGFLGKGTEFPASAWTKRFQIIDNFSLFLGNHSLKFGFDYHHIPGGGSVALYQPGELIFATDDPFDAANPMTYPMALVSNVGGRDYDMPQTIGTLFIQDAWRVTSRLTLNYGLRYNYYSISQLDIQAFHFPSNFNPRFGFSWDPLGDGKTAVRGGIGAYTSNLMGNAAFDIAYLSKVKISLILFPNYPDPTQPNPWWPFWESVLGLPPGYLSSQGGAESLGTYKAKNDQIAPYSIQTTLGVQREIFKDLSISADLVYTKGYGLLRKENENPIIAGTGGLRQDPTKGDVWRVTDGGKSEFKGAYFNLEKRYSRGWALQMSYTLGWSKTDTERISTIENYEPDGWRRQYGYSDSDARHIVSATGIVDLPWGFQLSGVLLYRTAFPWNALYGYDENLDGLISDYMDEFRNSRRGFDHFYVNARISKFFTFGRIRVQAFGELYNVTNRANYYQISSNSISPNFGEPTAALDPRLLQLGLRFDF
jgi:hypothetical protein